MYKARQFLSKRALLDLYYAYNYPYMTYCIEVYFFCKKNYCE